MIKAPAILNKRSLFQKLWRLCCVVCFLNISIISFPQVNHTTDLKGLDRPRRVVTLQEVTELALANNFDIQIAKYDSLIAQTDEGVAESIYDTIINAEVGYRNNQSKPASTLAGNKTLENTCNFGISKKLPVGTTITGDFKNNRNWTDSSFASLNPSHDSSLGVTIEQELGKNLLGIQDRGKVKLTKLDIENSQYTSLDRIEASLAGVQAAYWDLALQLERVEIEEDMVEQAKTLYDSNEQKFQNGLVELPELLASEANYKSRINDLLLARNLSASRENVLKLLLNIGDQTMGIIPADAMQIDGSIEELDAALKLAFDNRRDYKEARNIIEKGDIKLSMEKNNLWPQINLTASLARNGVDDHFNQAVHQIAEEDNPDFYAGLKLSWHAENTEARANLKAAKLQKAKALVSIKLLERQISIAIIDQMRLCHVSKEVAANRINIASLQAEKLKEEEKKFKRGRSDTDTIIRFQEDLNLARLLEAEAKFRYQEALIGLRRAEGVLLDRYWSGDNL